MICPANHPIKLSKKVSMIRFTHAVKDLTMLSQLNLINNYLSIFLLTFFNIIPLIDSPANDSDSDLYKGCTMNFKKPNSFFAITSSLSKFSMNGDCGIPNSASFFDWFMNSSFTSRLHSLQTSNSFVDAPKSLEWINMPQSTFSSSRSSFLKLFFFYSYLLRTLKCSYRMDYWDVVKQLGQVRTFGNLERVVEASVANIVAKSTDHKDKFGKISQEQVNVGNVGERKSGVHDWNNKKYTIDSMGEVVKRVVMLLVTFLELFQEIDKFLWKLRVSQLVKRHFLHDFICQLELERFLDL